MPGYQTAVTRLPTSTAVAGTAAEIFIAEVRAVHQREALLRVALSGGRIARQFFEATAALGTRRAAPLAGVHFFWADERCVPPEDPESNYGLARQHLLEPLGIAPDHVHRIHGEVPPTLAASAASAELRKWTETEEGSLPPLDLVFLGMGEDGHIASIFPEAVSRDLGRAELFYPVTATKPPPQRITLSMGMLAAARKVCVLASGPGKERALADSLSSTGETPLALLLRQRSETLILTDLPGG